MSNENIVQDNEINPVQRVIVGDRGGREVKVDPIVRGIKTIDTFHQETHAGEAFIISLMQLAVADDANVDLFIAVGDKELHMTFSGGAAGDAHAFLYEGSTHTSGGTPVVAYNRYRSSTVTSTATFTAGGVNVPGATAIISQYVPGGSKNQATGGDAGEREEIILAANTNYLARITNKSGGNDDFSMKMSWYEEDPM
jgi:hypothetical protein